MNATQPLTDDDGAAVVSFEDSVTELRISKILKLDDEIERLSEQRDELATEVIAALDAGTGSIEVDGVKVTVVRQLRRSLSITVDELKESISRRLYAKLTKHVFELASYDAHVKAGTVGIDAVTELIKVKETAPSLRITR